VDDISNILQYLLAKKVEVNIATRLTYSKLNWNLRLEKLNLIIAALSDNAATVKATLRQTKGGFSFNRYRAALMLAELSNHAATAASPVFRSVAADQLLANQPSSESQSQANGKVEITQDLF
jgi:hypothetical protein